MEAAQGYLQDPSPSSALAAEKAAQTAGHEGPGAWAAQAAENGKWPGDFSHEKFITWEDSRAEPQELADYIVRQRENDKAGDLTSHGVTPLTITIVGDTAVVAYSAELEFVNNVGETGSSVRNFLEVLIRDGGGWQYLASTDFTPNHEN